jgi:hypothetical protein
MDKDSKLLFENYRKIYLNEAAPALALAAIPALPAIAPIAAAIGLAAVGTLVVAYAYDKLKNVSISQPDASKVNSQIETIEKTIQKKDISIRGMYELVNVGNALGIPVISSVLSTLKNGVDSYKLAQDSVNVTNETYREMYDAFVTAGNNAIDLARKTNSPRMQPAIQEIIDVMNAQQIVFAPVIQNVVQTPSPAIPATGGPGGEPPDDKDKNKKPKGGINTNEFITNNWKLLAIILFLGIIFLLITVPGAASSAGEKTSRAGREFGEGLWKGATDDTGGSPQATPQPTPKPSGVERSDF